MNTIHNLSIYAYQRNKPEKLSKYKDKNIRNQRYWRTHILWLHMKHAIYQSDSKIISSIFLIRNLIKIWKIESISNAWRFKNNFKKSPRKTTMDCLKIFLNQSLRGKKMRYNKWEKIKNKKNFLKCLKNNKQKRKRKKKKKNLKKWIKSLQENPRKKKITQIKKKSCLLIQLNKLTWSPVTYL